MVPKHAAFTLIELMVAVALGMLLVYTVASGFRVASQSVTVANRLSLENSMMRAGFQTAHEYLDFWVDVDDPDDTTRQRLRDHGQTITNHAPLGNAFSSFNLVMPGTAFVASDANARDETTNGWDPRDIAWSASNPRSWFQGDMGQKCYGGNVDLRSGRYTIFSNTADSLNSSDFSQVRGKGYGPVTTIPHHWRDRTVMDLLNGLGYYGMCDYLPANSIYAIYSPTWQGGNYWENTDLGGIPLWCTSPEGDPEHFCNTDGMQITPRGKYRLTYMTSYAMPNPESVDTPANLFAANRRFYSLSYASTPDDMRRFNSLTTVPEQVLVSRPASWPEVTVSVARYIKNCRHVAMCRIRWRSPLSGEVVELSFAGFGTSLRGARQQRTATGWATWDNATPRGSFPTPPPANLDSP